MFVELVSLVVLFFLVGREVKAEEGGVRLEGFNGGGEFIFIFVIGDICRRF